MAEFYNQALPRHEAEALRLQEQCRIFTQNLGYSLHPAVLKRLKNGKEPLIADVATGTATWLLGLAQEMPEARLHGFDISDRMFPPQDLRPERLQLHIANMKEPFPSEFHGTFDVVHVRAAVAAMDPPDWETVLSNLVTLLKPGGAIQWDEADFGSTKYFRSVAPPVEPYTPRACVKVTALWFSHIGERVNHGWNTLPAVMSSHGELEEQVIRDVVGIDRLPETRRAISRNHGPIMIAATRRFNLASQSELDTLEKDFYAEIDAGWYASYGVHVAIAFKRASC